MSSFNQVILIGNLGCDPIVLKSNEHGNFVRLSLATTKRYRKKSGEVRNDTQWHTVYLSNGLGRVASSHLLKGAKVLVSGELRTREWHDDAGQTHYSTAVYARELKFLSAKQQKNKEGEPDFIEESGTFEELMQDSGSM